MNTIDKDGSAGDGVPSDALARELADMNAVFARSEAALTEAKTTGMGSLARKNPLVFDLDWDKDQHLQEFDESRSRSQRDAPVLGPRDAASTIASLSVAKIPTDFL